MNISEAREERSEGFKDHPVCGYTLEGLQFRR